MILPPDGFSSNPTRSSKGSKSANAWDPLDDCGSKVVAINGPSTSQPRPAQTPASSASQGTMVVDFQWGMIKTVLRRLHPLSQQMIEAAR